MCCYIHSALSPGTKYAASVANKTDSADPDKNTPDKTALDHKEPAVLPNTLDTIRTLSLVSDGDNAAEKSDCMFRHEGLLPPDPSEMAFTD